MLFDGVDFSETLTKLPQVQEELDQHNEERTKEEDSLEAPPSWTRAPWP